MQVEANSIFEKKAVAVRFALKKSKNTFSKPRSWCIVLIKLFVQHFRKETYIVGLLREIVFIAEYEFLIKDVKDLRNAIADCFSSCEGAPSGPEEGTELSIESSSMNTHIERKISLHRQHA